MRMEWENLLLQEADLQSSKEEALRVIPCLVSLDSSLMKISNKTIPLNCNRCRPFIRNVPS